MVMPQPQLSGLPAPSVVGAAQLPHPLPVAQLRSIGTALQAVEALRAAGRAQSVLHQAVMAIKRAQCHRFRRSYADVLTHPDWGAAAAFFLQELYGDRDYTHRDMQFGRIAPAMQRLFPASVLGVATTLTQLHAVSEQLDYAMGAALVALQAPGVTELDALAAYVQTWRAVSLPAVRAEQFALVLELGHALAQLVRTPGLRTMLRMMRGTANAAGLQDLQHFLETGFDTFAALQRSKSGVVGFLTVVEQREQAWMTRLFDPGLTNTYSAQLWPELE